VADVRVFKAKAAKWHHLNPWRVAMTRRGRSLLKVTTTDTTLVAVFSKTENSGPAQP
jgi:hypothetical protein